MIYNRDFKRNYQFSEYVSVEDFKSYPLSLDIELTDAQIKFILDNAGYVIQKVITRPILLTPVIDRVTGNDTYNIMVRYPINALNKLLENYGTSSEEVADEYIKLSSISVDTSPLYSNNIEKLNSVWDSECIYEFQYTTGSITFPSEVKMATILTAASIINNQERKGIKSVKIADLQVNYSQEFDIIPPEALSLLSDWITKQYVV